MKLNMFVMAIAITLILICAPVLAFSGTGNGTQINPYIITSTSQWDEMQNSVDHFALGNNLSWMNTPYVMIHGFTGTLDGRTFAIADIYINNATETDVGIFQTAGKAGYWAIQNLYIANATVISDRDCYVIVGGGHELNMGILIGRYQGGSGGSTYSAYNIFVDSHSSVLWTGNTSALYQTGDAFARIGTVVGNGAESSGMWNIVSLADISVTEGTGMNVNIGGILGTGSWMNNGVYAGTINFAPPLGFTTIKPSFITASNPEDNNYYDTTLCDSFGTIAYGMPTSQMMVRTNYLHISSWRETDPVNGEMVMSPLASEGHGYPVPYVLSGGVIPSPTPTPTPIPTPTPTPTTTPTPLPTGTPTGTPTPIPTTTYKIPTIRWETNKSVVTTTAYTGDTVRFSYNTVGTGLEIGSDVYEYLYISIKKKNVQTGLWYNPTYPAYYSAVAGGNTFTHYDPYDIASFNGAIKVGYGTTTVPENTVYRVSLYGINLSCGCGEIIAYSDLTVSKNPYLASNVGDWLTGTGGTALSYAIAIVIIIILASIPFLILRRMVPVIEVIMIALGLGISLYMHLIPLWVPFGIGIGMLAVFLLTRRQEV